ncbi:MAG: hypothetical protein QXV69_07175 [Sulfolobaceae archaeon]
MRKTALALNGGEGEITTTISLSILENFCVFYTLLVQKGFYHLISVGGKSRRFAAETLLEVIRSN